MVRPVVPPLARTADRNPSVLPAAVVRVEGNRTVVALSGELDLSTRMLVSDALAKTISLLAGDVVIDFTEVEFVDTSIVRALAKGQQLLARQGRHLTFRSPSRLAVRLLDLFGLTDLIETDPGRTPVPI